MSSDEQRRDSLGLCQWFHFQDYAEVERSVASMTALGLRHLRTGISWADFHRPEGPDWYRWLLERLSAFELLISVWHTPPSISEAGFCADPPRRLEDYADFIAQLTELYGPQIAGFELWNEPNNRYKWDFPRRDPDWRKFGTMIRSAAATARARGFPCVLGGMIPVDPHWLRLMDAYGVLDHVDAISIHGFPGMWWPNHPNWDWYSHWRGWDDKLATAAAVRPEVPIWITETGLATWDLDTDRPARFDLQEQMLLQALEAATPRLYWYSLRDLDPSREAIEGFHVDENEYHLGLETFAGERKPAWYLFRELLAGTPRVGKASLES
jgi:CDP-paratose 2-epimerase